MNDKELLEKTYNLAKENSKILKGIQRKSRISSTIGIIKWILIILITIWSYSLIQPVIGQMQEVYGTVQETSDTIKDLQDSSGIGNLLNIFKGGE